MVSGLFGSKVPAVGVPTQSIYMQASDSSTSPVSGATGSTEPSPGTVEPGNSGLVVPVSDQHMGSTPLRVDPSSRTSFSDDDQRVRPAYDSAHSIPLAQMRHYPPGVLYMGSYLPGYVYPQQLPFHAPQSPQIQQVPEIRKVSHDIHNPSGQRIPQMLIQPSFIAHNGAINPTNTDHVQLALPTNPGIQQQIPGINAVRSASAPNAPVSPPISGFPGPMASTMSRHSMDYLPQHHHHHHHHHHGQQPIHPQHNQRSHDLPSLSLHSDNHAYPQQAEAQVETQLQAQAQAQAQQEPYLQLSPPSQLKHLRYTQVPSSEHAHLQNSPGLHTSTTISVQSRPSGWDSRSSGSGPAWQPGFTQDVKMRTKTGCLTCRRRRVKCDEQRPNCRNCMKSERVCLGYDTIFTRTRGKRIEELSMRRRVQRNSWKMKISSLLETPGPISGSMRIPDVHEEPHESISGWPPFFQGKSVNANTWVDVARLFRDYIARDLDQLIGTDSMYKNAQRVVDCLAISDDTLIMMASELEAMRQIVTMVFPWVECNGLNIMDANLPLEKLKTNDMYYTMRGIVEALSLDFQNQLALPARKRQKPEQPQEMETWLSRLNNLGRLLHLSQVVTTDIPFKRKLELLAMATKIIENLADDKKLTDAVWDIVQYVLAERDENIVTPPPVPINTELENISEQLLDLKCQEAAEEVKKHTIQGDSRGMLALIALSTGGCSASLRAITTLENLHGLTLALGDIAIISRSTTFHSQVKT